MSEGLTELLARYEAAKIETDLCATDEEIVVREACAAGYAFTEHSEYQECHNATDKAKSQEAAIAREVVAALMSNNIETAEPMIIVEAMRRRGWDADYDDGDGEINVKLPWDDDAEVEDDE